eukprot:1182880-Prorocentrum_minimum.AAC.1
MDLVDEPAPRRVDWDRTLAQLAEIPDDFKDISRFNPAPHVLRVLGSEDWEDELEKLREQQRNVEAMVDQVVEVHHNGFNKSIQNYSQILRLFTESTSLLEQLKTDLKETRRCAGTPNNTLQKQWRQDLTTRRTLEHLQDIETATTVPARVGELMDRRQLEPAATLLAETLALLDQAEFQK